MSIINDALKKAERDRHFPASLGRTKNRSRIWFVFSGTALICLLSFILATGALRVPLLREKLSSGSAQETNLKPKSLPTETLNLRDIDIESLSASSEERPIKTQAFQLSGILYDTHEPLAIINDRIVGIGTSVSGAQLIDIQPGYVRLSFQGRTMDLKIK